MGTLLRASWFVWALVAGCTFHDGAGWTHDGEGVVSETFPPAPSEPTVVMDDRAVQTAPKPPPAISGGTLLVTRDGKRAVAADPERDRVSIVGLPERALLFTVALQSGDEPGRLAEDGTGRVHIALRRGGALATIDIQSGALVARRTVCGAPRGVAYEAQTDQLHVACAGGSLVTLPAAGGDATRRLELGADLRDVVVRADGLWVSRFKSADIIALDAQGSVVQSIELGGVLRRSDKINEFGVPTTESESVEAAVAWRMLPALEGGAVVMHQYALAEPIELDEEPAAAPTQIVQRPYGAVAPLAPLGGCGGLVQPAVSTVDGQGQLHKGAPIVAPVLAVDAALSPDGMWVALAHAGVRDPGAPSSGFDTGPGSLGQLTVVATAETSVAIEEGALLGDVTPCLPASLTLPIDGQATAVAFNPATDAEPQAGGTLILVQTREPARLMLITSTMGDGTVIDLGGPSMLDTGHDIFHRDSGAGIACVSCHVEGGEDGRVWRFTPIGDRRTQAVHVGLAGTMPFHWDGDMTDLDTLMEEVFVRRMGGPRQTPERLDALASWLFTLEPPPPIVDGHSAEAVRGRALFDSPSVGCVDCHSGTQLTNNRSVEVGTTEPGHPVQVPSLVGIGYRAPFLHTGCAATLRQRFDPACGGGDAHGRTSQLGSGEIDDLIAYLESL